MSQQFTEEFVTDQIQRRYFYHHIVRLTDLCYPEILKDAERATQAHIPLFVQCISKLNSGVAFIQEASN